MTQKEFLEKMVDILDYEDELTMDISLDNIEEWDSLGVIAFLAEMGKHTTSQIKADDVKKAKSVADLFALIK